MTSSQTLKPRALNRATLARQMLLERAKVAVVPAVERLVGLQAQVPRPPFVALWARLAGFRREQLAAAIEERALVRATAMRGTLHLLSARNFLAWRRALQPMLSRGAESILGDRLGEVDVAAVVAAARAFFARGPCTFEAVRAHLGTLGLGADERALGYAVRTELPLVQVPTADPWSFPATADFALADDWLGAPADAGDPEPDSLLFAYLAAYGPASVADAQAWTGLQKLAPVFERLRPKLVTFRDEKKRELFDLPKAPRPDAETPAPVRFLPEWDSMIVARTDERFFATAHRKAIFQPGLRVLPTFLVDGLAAGTWKLDIPKSTKTKPAQATLTLSPFAPLSRSARAELESEAHQLLLFAAPRAEGAIAFESAVRSRSSKT